MLDKERKEKKCLHQIAAHEELSFAIFCLGSFPFCRYVAHNLESFLVSLVDVSQNSQKNNRNKTDTCLEGWGVGDTHFAGSHIGGIHILTSDISLRSKRFRLVSEQEIPRNGILGFGRARNETRATLGSR